MQGPLPNEGGGQSDRESADERVRVVMIGCAPPLRGISSYCLELAFGLSQRVPLEFLSFRSMYPRRLYPGGGLKADLTFPEIDHSDVTVRRVLDWYNPLGWIAAAARIRADIVHAQHWCLPLIPVLLVMLSVLKMRRIRVVLTIHNIVSHEKSRLYQWGTRVLCRLADMCVMHSEANRSKAEEVLRLPRRKTVVIPHGVLSFLNDGNGDSSAARKHLGLPDTAPVVLCFGAIRPYKGLDVMMRAFAGVLAELPEAVLVVAGKVWTDWEPYQRLAEEHGIVSNTRLFLDYIDSADVKRFFQAADLIALPYKEFDAQSGVGMIALAFGKPMVVTSVGALPELVQDSRCVSPPNDADALAQRLLLGLTDEAFRRKASADAVETARSFSRDEVADRTVSLYRRVCRT